MTAAVTGIRSMHHAFTFLIVMLTSSSECSKNATGWDQVKFMADVHRTVCLLAPVILDFRSRILGNK